MYTVSPSGTRSRERERERVLENEHNGDNEIAKQTTPNVQYLAS